MSLTKKQQFFVEQQFKVYDAKNKLYDDSFNKSLDKWGEIAFCVRAEDKLNRIRKLTSGKDMSKELEVVSDEKLTDTIRDLFNYCAMYEAWDSNFKVKNILGDMTKDAYEFHRLLFGIYGDYDGCLNEYLLDPNKKEDRLLFYQIKTIVKDLIENEVVWEIK